MFPDDFFSFTYCIYRKAEHDFAWLCPAGARRAYCDPAGGAESPVFFHLLNYNGRPITCHHSVIFVPYGVVLKWLLINGVSADFASSFCHFHRLLLGVHSLRNLHSSAAATNDVTNTRHEIFYKVTASAYQHDVRYSCTGLFSIVYSCGNNHNYILSN